MFKPNLYDSFIYLYPKKFIMHILFDFGGNIFLIPTNQDNNDKHQYIYQLPSKISKTCSCLKIEHHVIHLNCLSYFWRPQDHSQPPLWLLRIIFISWNKFHLLPEPYQSQHGWLKAITGGRELGLSIFC